MNFIGVILAAGMGTRLGELGVGRGKILPELIGKPMINYAIDFMRELGASRIFVVGGYMFSKLQEMLKGVDIDLRENTDYQGKGNLLSLFKVLPEIDNSFLMMNVDHIYSRSLVPVIQSQFHNITAFCDFDRTLGVDDMKVLLESGIRNQESGRTSHELFNNDQERENKIPNSKFLIPNSRLKTMSKQLTEFHCGYVGMTYVDTTELEKYKKAANEVLALRGDQAVVENILAHLAEKGEKVSLGDISGYGWLEIDTPEEFYKAEKAVLKNPQKFLISNS